VDLALELRRRGKDLEAAGDASAAAMLLADSAAQLELARQNVPPGSKLAGLLRSVLAAWRQAEEVAGNAGNTAGSSSSVRRPHAEDSNTLGSVEEEVDAELDRLVTELEQTLSELFAAARTARAGASSETAVALPCKFSCGRLARSGSSGGRTFDTCCRACARCSGAGSHDSSCNGGAGASTAAIVPASTALATTSDAVEPYVGGADGEGGGSGASAPPAGDGTAVQGALRCLGLSDEWPTELTTREIRRRYMRECLASHPDKGSPEEKDWRTRRFQELSTAYSLLEVQMACLERIRGGQEAEASPPAGEHSSAGPPRECQHATLPSSLAGLPPQGQLLALRSLSAGPPLESQPLALPSSGASADSGMLALEGPGMPSTNASVAGKETNDFSRSLEPGGLALPGHDSRRAPVVDDKPVRRGASGERSGSLSSCLQCNNP